MIYGWLNCRKIYFFVGPTCALRQQSLYIASMSQKLLYVEIGISQIYNNYFDSLLQSNFPESNNLSDYSTNVWLSLVESKLARQMST